MAGRVESPGSSRPHSNDRLCLILLITVIVKQEPLDRKHIPIGYHSSILMENLVGWSSSHTCGEVQPILQLCSSHCAWEARERLSKGQVSEKEKERRERKENELSIFFKEVTNEEHVCCKG